MRIVAKFEGTSLKMIMNSTDISYYIITIDGVSKDLTILKSNTVYLICSDLEDTLHTVTVFKRHMSQNAQNFNGFELDDNRNLVSPPERKA